MDARNRAAEIAELRRRSPRALGLYVSFRARGLLDHWQKRSRAQRDAESVFAPTQDFYPVRAVTLLEVTARAWTAQFVDSGPPYVERALDIAKSLKFDLELVKAIEGRAITLGDVIAHSASLNSFNQLVAHFDVLLGKRFLSLLEKAFDKWDARILGKEPTPIVSDIESLCRNLARLFEARHILVHEIPKGRVLRAEEVEPLLQSTFEFAHAAEEVLAEALWGEVPLTGVEQRTKAWADFQKVEKEMNSLLQLLKDQNKADAVRLVLLEKSQCAWLPFARAQADLRADEARGGTLAGLLATREMDALTTDRTKQLRAYLKEEDEGETI
jgi:uncharacterized protein YecT (DUF1311 family)